MRLSNKGMNDLTDNVSTAHLSVTDFGAKGDGVTDDTAAIQRAINAVAERGGTLFFPYAEKGYLIASPGREFDKEGRPVRAQLVIPAGARNFCLEGEMPCSLLYTYQVRPIGCEKNHFTPTRFGRETMRNTTIHSTWDAPEVHDPSERPWAVIAAPEGASCIGRFSVSMVSVKNLEIAVHLDHGRMYPTTSAANFHNVSRLVIQDSQFCLDDNVGDTYLDKHLLESPCHTVGLHTSGDQNDQQILRDVAVQGFKYGFVLGEHVVADHLYVHNCEEAVVFHDSSHLSSIGMLVAQHNRTILSTTRGVLFENPPGPANVQIDLLNFEGGQTTGVPPWVSHLRYGIYDPGNRLRGSVTWHEPWGENAFPVVGAKNFRIERFGGLPQRTFAGAAFKPPAWHGVNLLGLFREPDTTGVDSRADDGFREEHFRWLRDWGFNFARLPMHYRNWCPDDDWTKFDDSVFDKIDAAVAYGRRYGVHVQLCFHAAPGFRILGWEKMSEQLRSSPRAQAAFCEQWRRFARRYRGIPSEYLSFNPLNEPAGFSEEQYIKVFSQVVDVIHKEDSERFIMLDGNNVGSTPVPAFFDAPLTGQAFRGYTPHAISHFGTTYVDQPAHEPGWPCSPSLDDNPDSWLWEQPETTMAKYDGIVPADYPMMIGEFGCYNKISHATALAWMEHCLKLWNARGYSWAIWNLNGPFGFIDSGRADAEYEDFEGHKLDRRMLDLLRKYAP